MRTTDARGNSRGIRILFVKHQLQSSRQNKEKDTSEVTERVTVTWICTGTLSLFGLH